MANNHFCGRSSPDFVFCLRSIWGGGVFDIRSEGVSPEICVSVCCVWCFLSFRHLRNIVGVAKLRKNIGSDFLLEHVFKSIWKHQQTRSNKTILRNRRKNMIQQVFSQTGEMTKNIWKLGETISDVWCPMLDIQYLTRFPPASVGAVCPHLYSNDY